MHGVLTGPLSPAQRWLSDVPRPPHCWTACRLNGAAHVCNYTHAQSADRGVSSLSEMPVRCSLIKLILSFPEQSEGSLGPVHVYQLQHADTGTFSPTLRWLSGAPLLSLFLARCAV